MDKAIFKEIITTNFPEITGIKPQMQVGYMQRKWHLLMYHTQTAENKRWRLSHKRTGRKKIHHLLGHNNKTENITSYKGRAFYKDERVSPLEIHNNIKFVLVIRYILRWQRQN